MKKKRIFLLHLPRTKRPKWTAASDRTNSSYSYFRQNDLKRQLCCDQAIQIDGCLEPNELKPQFLFGMKEFKLQLLATQDLAMTETTDIKKLLSECRWKRGGERISYSPLFISVLCYICSRGKFEGEFAVIDRP